MPQGLLGVHMRIPRTSIHQAFQKERVVLSLPPKSLGSAVPSVLSFGHRPMAPPARRIMRDWRKPPGHRAIKVSASSPGLKKTACEN